jgi:nucleoside-diphosphate-sugar epimerase
MSFLTEKPIKCVITGANGFVGSRLVQRLNELNCEVVPCVRSAESAQGAAVVGDIDASTNWAAFLRGASAVIHTAARVHIMNDRSDDPLLEFRKVNVDGTVNLACQAADAGVRRYIFISSVKVNGEATQPGHPFCSDDLPAPEDPYGISKNEAEIALRKIADRTGMEVVIVRPPLIYGPGVKGNFAMMMRWLAKGVPLPLGSVDQNHRSMVGLDNMVDLLLTCISHPAAANQTFMVSDGEDMSTAELLRQLGNAMGKPARLLPVPVLLLRFGASILGKGNEARRLLGSLQVDISKTCELLNWTPPISVNEGLRRSAME